jgi:membrane protease YdiL (CAAX protease family)
VVEREPAGETRGLLRTDAGRLRLGWRILTFLLVATVITVAVALVMPPSVLSQSVAVLVGSLVGGWLLLATDGRGPGALGFHLGGSGPRETTAGLGVGVLIGGVAVALIGLAGGLRWTGEPGTLAGWVMGAVGALSFLVLPAAAEEALLRGYPFQALTESWGPQWALAVTSCLFGLAHLGNPGVTALAIVNVAAAGLMLGVIYLRTASLWWATGAHLGWNWAQGYAADVPVSGLELLDAPYYESVVQGPEWLGGGSFGPEGSLLATAVLLAAAAACWRTGWLRPSGAALRTQPLVLVPVDS